LYADIYTTNIGRGTVSHIVRILLISSGQTKLIAHQKHDSHNANWCLFSRNDLFISL